jgi:hypothetical protein
MLRDILGRRASENDQPIFMNTPSPLAEPREEDYAQNLNDDVFGSAPSSPILSATATQDGSESREAHPSAGRNHGADHSDIPRLRSIHVTNGYREGIAASKEQYIQAGFDEGYSLGGEIGTKAGWCLGALEGLSRGLAASKSTAASVALKEEAKDTWEKAGEELKMEKLLSSDYFGPDGVWLYDVPGQENETDVTFGDVANAHPLLNRWKATVNDLAQKAGLVLVQSRDGDA